jgi:FixJ family two-component response regulator
MPPYPNTAPPPGDREPPLIAVVDDEESIRRAMVRLLRSAHYRAAAFNSAGAFLASLAERVPECVVVDLQMPTMTGLELQEELVQLGEPLPIVIITAYDEPDTRDRCIALGAKHYFRKPIDGKVLIESIQEIIAASRPEAMAASRPGPPWPR